MPTRGDDWTESEEQTLRNNWDAHTAQEIADMLPGRTKDAVYSKHNRMEETSGSQPGTYSSSEEWIKIWRDEGRLRAGIFEEQYDAKYDTTDAVLVDDIPIENLNSSTPHRMKQELETAYNLPVKMGHGIDRKPVITVDISRDTFLDAWVTFIEDRIAGRKPRTGVRIPLQGKHPEDVDRAEAEAYRPRPNARYPDPETKPIQLGIFRFIDHDRFRRDALDGDYYFSFDEMVNEAGLKPSTFDVESFDQLSQEEKEESLEINNDIYLDSVWSEVQNVKQIETDRAVLKFNWQD